MIKFINFLRSLSVTHDWYNCILKLLRVHFIKNLIFNKWSSFIALQNLVLKPISVFLLLTVPHIGILKILQCRHVCLTIFTPYNVRLWLVSISLIISNNIGNLSMNKLTGDRVKNVTESGNFSVTDDVQDEIPLS